MCAQTQKEAKGQLAAQATAELYHASAWLPVFDATWARHVLSDICPHPACLLQWVNTLTT